MTELLYSVRLAVRRMVRDGRFTLTIVFVFALGLGANAVIFGIVDELLLRPPAHVDRPDEVRRVVVDRPSGPTATLAYPDLVDLREVDGLSGVAAYVTADRVIGRHEQASTVGVTQVTGDYFQVLGVRMAAGRALLPDDDAAGADPVAVISYGLWQRRYGGDPDVLGRALDFAGTSYTIVGVAPRGFTGMDLRAVDIWAPIHVTAANASFWEDNRRFNWLNMVARVQGGADAEAVAFRATDVYRRGHGESAGEGAAEAAPRVLLASPIAARGPLASGESRVAKWLFGVSLLVLLIACANVANLLLARATTRSADTGVRLAMGASRRRVVAESVLDAALPAVLGAAAALVVAAWLGGFARSVLLPGVAWGEGVIDARLLGFVAGLTLAAGLGSGILAGTRAARQDVVRRVTGAGSRVSRRSRAMTGLAVVQTALSVVLLVGAGLFLRSLDAVRGTDLGFDAERVLVARPVLDGSWDPGENTRFFDEAIHRTERLPGVTAVARAAMTVPFGNQIFLDVTRGAEAAPEDERRAYVTNISPGFFRTLGMPLIAGRDIRPTDDAGSPPVAVVNRATAERFWAGEDAVGRCIALQFVEDAPCIRVVGVVEDAKRRTFQDEPFPQVFLASAQDVTEWGRDEVVLVRTAGDPSALAPRVRAEMLAALPRLRYAQVQVMEDLVDPQARPWRLGATMLSLFGLLALAVTGFGIYSIIAFDVARRSRELAIRSALGATGRRLLRGVVSRALAMSGLGVALGLGVAALAAPRMADLLYRTEPVEPSTYGLVAVVLLIATLLAALAPGRRAVRAEPARLMRTD